MSDDPCLYPGTQTLKNKLDIRDPIQLEKIERQLVTQRIRRAINALRPAITDMLAGCAFAAPWGHDGSLP